MPRIKPETGEYYHVFNRGVEKRKIFLTEGDYQRFLLCLREFNCLDPIYSLYRMTQLPIEIKSLQKKKLVEIIAYCLNPNHFHLLLKQIAPNGISEFMKRLGIGYTGFFNYRNKRSGVLFQGSYKSVRIRSNAHLLYISAYVNDNYFIHGYAKRSEKIWKYSGLAEYTSKSKKALCSRKLIKEHFKSFRDYCGYVKENSSYMKEKKEFEKYIVES
ncbi:MAG: transposase [Patescibacteria group bacterium]|nr:transposase [Patescibacteria group bacterium]